MFWFSADEHLLNVTEADSTGVSGPSGLHRLQFHNGERWAQLDDFPRFRSRFPYVKPFHALSRYSVIIDTKADAAGSSFYLRATMDTDCCRCDYSS